MDDSEIYTLSSWVLWVRISPKAAIMCCNHIKAQLGGDLHPSPTRGCWQDQFIGLRASGPYWLMARGLPQSFPMWVSP